MIGMLQMSLILVLFVNDSILPEGMRENKMMTFFAVFLGGQMVSSALTKTNAFEIYLGKKLIWSTIQHERMPNLQDIVEGFKGVGVQINARG